MNYWLFKSEPDEYSIDDLAAESSGVGRWDGIRNYQARNLLRDDVAKGDLVFFYHSSCKTTGIAGIARVVSDPYPDPAQFEQNNPYFDAKASPSIPRWYCVDVEYVEKFNRVLTLQSLKQIRALSTMVLLKQGRLSVQPVSEAEWNLILGVADRPEA